MNKIEIYFKSVITKEGAEKSISEISHSAAASIEMGYPAEHGGFFIEAKNGYIAQTSGGIIYGFIKRAVGGGFQTCAILGYHREGSLTKSLISAKWHKTTAFDWLEEFQIGLGSGYNKYSGYLNAPSNLNCNVAV